MLEVIERQPEAAARPTPLLFVHGFWHAAWCWEEFFLPYFAARGFRCYAPSLRGHGASPGSGRLRTTRIRDYADDIAETVAQLRTEPILVGHSAGGFVVQKYLEDHTAAGMILLAPISPTGAAETTVRTMVRHPVPFLRANLSLSLAPLVATPELARSLFFSASMPQKQVTSYQQRLQDDSYLGFLDLVVLDLVRTRRVNGVPTLVLGGEKDTLTTPAQVRRTARTYGTEAEIFAGMAHDMMLEAGWQTVAERMAAWLGQTFPARPIAPQN